MDLVTVRTVRMPRTRADLALAPGERPLGGGTWLYSEEQPGLTGLVDLTALGWTPVERTATHLVVAATCTIAALTRLAAEPDWTAYPLVADCSNALLASFKVWNVATVGGNVATALPAGAMTALLTTLDADVVVWTPDGGERRVPMPAFVRGVRATDLAQGEVIRAFAIPLRALRSRTASRRVSLSPHGRSGAFVTSRLDPDGAFTVVLTASVPRPVRFRWDAVPTPSAVLAELDGIDDWYDDPHGTPDWRRAVSTRFALELRDEAAEVLA